MDKILQLAEKNSRRARSIIEKVRIREAWQSVGAEINLVGSLRMGLMMTHKDIDFHIYTPELKISDSFQAMALIAEKPGIKRIEYANLLNCPDTCLEWHAWYEDEESNIWQIDMMHIVKGSRYDGFFEKTADKIRAVMTPQQKEMILKLKYETPENEKIPGIEYYRAVIAGGVKSLDELKKWRSENPGGEIIEWQPE